MDASTKEQSQSAEEVRVISKYVLLAALIKYAFDFFFLVVLACYIFLMFGALKYYPLFYAALAIAFMSPYFIMMLKMLPLLKGFYVKKIHHRVLPCDAPRVVKMQCLV